MADEPRAEDSGRTFLGGVRDTYAKIPAGRRRIMLVVGLAVMAGLLFVVVSASAKEPWRPVARELAPDDLEAATKAFDEKKIAYRLGDGGSILVAPEAIYEARLALAVNAMPSGKSVGFEVFDESGMGRSAFTEKVNLHRALEGELARTIRYIDGIERVRVHLVTPERRVFKDLDVAPSASVILALKAGATMTRETANAIRQLVSGAVERLVPGQVSIVDQHGRMLTQPDQDGVGSGDAFERQREQERALEERVVHLLEPIVGTEKALVRVAMDLDLSRVVETREDFDPNQQVVRSEREQLEKDAVAGAPPSGPPGTASNLPGGQIGGRNGAGNGTGREKSDTIRNYEVDKVVTRKEDPMPRLRKLSVAVLVDEASELKDGKLVPKLRTPDELAQLTRLVSHAVGLDTARGDQIEVTSAPFASVDLIGTGDEVPPVGGVPTPVEVPLWEQPLVLIAAGAGLLLLIALVVGLRVASGRKKKKALELALVPPPVETVDIAETNPETLAAMRRARIAELRERALALGNEDLPRLVVVFERWFDADKAEHELDNAVVKRPNREAA